MFVRTGTEWRGEVFGGGMRLVLPKIGVEVPLAEPYERPELGGFDVGAEAEGAG